MARTVPALVSLKRHWPEAQVDWLIREGYEEVIRHHPDLADCLPFPAGRDAKTGQGRTARLWQTIRVIRARQYDMVIDLQGLARSGLVTGTSGAPQKVGFADARELGWLGYNRRVDAPRSLHAVERTLRLIEGMDVPPVADLSLYVGEDDENWFAQWSREQNLTPGQYLCLAPTARWLCKCWPVEKYAQVAVRLLESGRVADKVVILASASEQASLKPMLDLLGDRAVLPNTTVGQMMAILNHTRLLICNDSAPLHIGVGLGRPVVTIFAATNPALVGPYKHGTVVTPPDWTPPDGRQYRQLRDDQSLISQVSIDQVLEAVQRQLGSGEMKNDG